VKDRAGLGWRRDRAVIATKSPAVEAKAMAQARSTPLPGPMRIMKMQPPGTGRRLGLGGWRPCLPCRVLRAVNSPNPTPPYANRQTTARLIQDTIRKAVDWSATGQSLGLPPPPVFPRRSQAISRRIPSRKPP
jgi:hypothetical protein